MAIAPNLPPEPPTITDYRRGNNTEPKQITNYRVEQITQGYILHVTHGAQTVGEKYAFLDKVALLAHLAKVL